MKRPNVERMKRQTLAARTLADPVAREILDGKASDEDWVEADPRVEPVTDWTGVGADLREFLPVRDGNIVGTWEHLGARLAGCQCCYIVDGTALIEFMQATGRPT